MAEAPRIDRLRVGVLFGGRSGEHDVSLASAASLLASIDRTQYEPVPIGIDRSGRWLLAEHADLLLTREGQTKLASDSDGPAGLSGGELVSVSVDGAPNHLHAVDVVFPVLHGPLGEDGTIQGLLRMADMPFVGSDVLGSALAMDKGYMKDRFAFLGLPQVGYIVVTRSELAHDPDDVVARVERNSPYPVFVKPCNLGSSVGIGKAHTREELLLCLTQAARHGHRIIVEEGIEAREVECGVLGNESPEISQFGEVVSGHEWYDYESKYTDGLADLRIPADLTPEQHTRGQDLARRAFGAVGASGLARVDLFVRRADGMVLLNEINTMPGFTRTSMFPKVWEASGVSYTELISRLISLGIERHQAQRHSFGA